LKNVGPIRHCEPQHIACFYIAIHQVSLLSHAATVARHLRIDVHNDDDNAWQRGPLWPHRMGPKNILITKCCCCYCVSCSKLICPLW